MSLSASLKSLYLGAVRRSAALDLPWLAALLILPAFRTMKPAEAAHTHTVVILAKEGFTEDIMTALADAGAIKVVGLPRIIVKALASPFLPYFIDDNNYASCGAEFDQAKLHYRRFILALLKTLRRFMRIDAMISGNFSYASEREFAAAMQDLGAPFVALHKENLKTPGRVEFFERIYKERRGPFTGRKILVYNQTERDLQISAGVAEPWRIEIVGMPRLDRMHAWRRANAGTLQRHRILFFVFSSATGMPRIARKTGIPGKIYFEDEESDDGDISLAHLSEGTCRALLHLARDNPDIEVVVKSKGRARDLKETAALFGLAREAEFPPNMRVVHGGDILPLIAQASVVCGFNSTALFEAIAAGKPAVMPWFAEAEAPEVRPYLIDPRGVGVAAPSPERLAATLVGLARDPKPVPAELDTDTRQTLALWTGNDDGDAATRTRDAILQELGGLSAHRQGQASNQL
jgi:hypothetical protein